MTIIVFLVDNSGSMSTRTVNGINYMDFVRQFVEAFLKQRQRDPISKNDRYMLMGFEEYPSNVKSGWKEAQSHFNEQLRQLRASGSSDFIEAFYNALRFVNLNRTQTGIENYGYGRYPSFSEPVVFIAVVDYNNLDLSEEFQDGFPPLPQPLGELTEEPFRWDHRLFVVGLDIPGHPPLDEIEDWMEEDEEEEYPEESPTFEHSAAKNMIHKVNGKLYRMRAAKQMNAILDAVLQKIQVNGVFVRLQQHGPEPSAPKNPLPEVPKEEEEVLTGITVVDGEAKDDHVAKNDQEVIQEEELDGNIVDWKKSVVLLHRGTKVHTNTQSSWPIPESYWPDQSTLQLPPRKVYPEISFRCDETEQVSTPGFPFDKYELESGPLAEYILNRRDPSCCWQLFVNNSYNRPGIGFPFGYMKAASNLQTVNVFIFPYNYPLLFAIIEECKEEKNRTTEEFKQKVERYFRTIPSYYIVPLRKVLAKYPIQHPMLDDSKPFHFLHFTVMQAVSKAKTQGKEDFEKTLQLPPRKVYPEISFRCDETEQVSTPGFPFDKYELESGPLAEYILNRRDPSCCWQLFVNNSYNRPGIGFPFGYMKAASNLQTVNVFIFPYNYPLLFAIIEECKEEKNRTTEEFKQKVERYFRTIPSYYIVPLRKVLAKYPIQHPMLDDSKPFHFLHFTVMQAVSKAKTQGKEDFEKTCTEIQKMERKPYFTATMTLPMAPVVKSAVPETLNQRKIGHLTSYKQQIQPLYKDATVAITPTRISKDTAQRFLNPYLVEREDIVDQLERMRVNLELNLNNSAIPVLEGGIPGQRIRLQHAEDLHAQPIQKMGDFNLYAKRLADIGFAPMRDFEPPQAKPHAFGNPFKLDKKSMAVDEVPPDLNEGPDTAQMPQNNGNGKEKDKKKGATETPSGNPRMMKRRVGPLDREALMRWRQRRLSNYSDAESVVSDLGYTGDLDNEIDAKRPRYAASEPGDLAPNIEEEEEMPEEEEDEQPEQENFSIISDEEMGSYNVPAGCTTTPSPSSVTSEDSGVRMDDVIEEEAKKPTKRLLNGKDNVETPEKNGNNGNVADENEPQEEVEVAKKKKKMVIESSEEEEEAETLDETDKINRSAESEETEEEDESGKEQKPKPSNSDEESEGEIGEDSIPMLARYPKVKEVEEEKQFKYDAREDLVKGFREEHLKSNKYVKKQKPQQNGDLNGILEDDGSCVVVEGIYVPLASSDDEEAAYVPDKEPKYMTRARLEKKIKTEPRKKEKSNARNGKKRGSDDGEDDEEGENSDSSFSSSEDEEEIAQKKEQQKLLDECFDYGREKSPSIEEEKVGIRLPLGQDDLPSCSNQIESPEVAADPVKHQQDSPVLSRIEMVELRCTIRCAVRNHSRAYDAYSTIKSQSQRTSVREQLQILSFAKTEASMHRRTDLEKQLDADIARLNQLILVEDHIHQSLDDSAPPKSRSISSSPARSEPDDTS
uniref:VWFA domain-containing protein n=1 Tax=Bursaphelenchus xylophilus TaxID=6326 RepID=A0A1I7RWK0_BURXY